MMQPPPGFVHLVLVPGDNPFYLEVPIAIVDTLCLQPRRYLRYLGWCVLGVEGVLRDEQGEITLDGPLHDRGIYRYVVPGNNVLAHAVDPEVIRQRSSVSSETTRTRGDFCNRLLERDGCCVLTGGQRGVDGMHIIPHARGDGWLRLIADNRLHGEDEHLDSLNINDIRNGICACSDIHNGSFDPRNVVILKTPNPILQTTDVPDRHERQIPTDASYPTHARYTLQWLVTPLNEFDQIRIPNNNDATFRNQRLPKPADLLLHYNYGVAAVKQWGKNNHILANRPDIPHPSAPVPTPMGPPKTKHNHTAYARKKLSTLLRPLTGRGAGRSEGLPGETTADTNGAPNTMDEDDIVLFFWANSKVAREMHARKEQEQTEYLENWRAGITGNPPIE